MCVYIYIYIYIICLLICLMCVYTYIYIYIGRLGVDGVQGLSGCGLPYRCL